MSGFWETFRNFDGRVSLVKKWIPVPVLTAVTAYGAYLWARFSHLHGVEQFVLTLSVVALCLIICAAMVVLLPYLRMPKVKGSITPVNMSSRDARLTFQNTGRRSDFFVKCEFTGQINTPNVLPNVIYDLPWENQRAKMLSIAKGDSAHLIIATWRSEDIVQRYYGNNVVHTTGIAELRAVGKEEPEYRLLWSCKPDSKLPACDLKVTVLSDGGRGKLERFFTLEPKDHYGPLQISEYFPLSTDGKRVRQ